MLSGKNVAEVNMIDTLALGSKGRKDEGLLTVLH